MISKQFGAKATKEDLKRYAQSPQWSGSKFVNAEETTIDISFENIPKLLYKQLCQKEGREPKKPLTIQPFMLNDFIRQDAMFKFIWYGHSVLLLRLNGKTILIDPMLGPNASPIAPFSTNRFSRHALMLIDDFPDIDILLLTHDHYDHLDLASMNKLKGKVRHYLVALGTKRHLVKWGINPEIITEVDWHDRVARHDIEFTFIPSRHFSGRGLRDRAMSLWGGWCMKTDGLNLYFSGDGGYGKHFKEIGEKYGPFDFGWMECGQYNENWRMIHMFPEESVQAALDSRVSKVMPVHWGAFSLAQHTWFDPVERFVNETARRSLECITPNLGELVVAAQSDAGNWWDKHL